MQQYNVLCLLLLFIYGHYTQAQDSTPPPPEWNGDSNICTVNPTQVNDKPQPSFSKKAEFTLEEIVTQHTENETSQSILIMAQYLYDYDNNKLVLIQNRLGYIDVEYYYYEALKVSNYFRREFCQVTDLLRDNAADGKTAILINRKWHIRPLNEFLLFSSNAPGRIIHPRYINQTIVRGIPVDTWESCVVDKTSKTTVQTVWHFAAPGVTLPTGLVTATDFAYPIQAIRRSSVLSPNGIYIDLDLVFNVHDFRQGIIETADQLAPPKGVFCKSPGQTLVSLEDLHMSWPERFSVRVEVSTSRTAQWQRFHLRYDRSFGGERSRRFRYDYLPVGAEDYVSVIHDFGDDLTYTIDRRIGSCQIHRGINLDEVNPIIDPIGFFVKNERNFITARDRKTWEINGFRRCRGDTILCTVVTNQTDDFPSMFDLDTNTPNGQTWTGMNAEYGWSTRAPAVQANSSAPFFDYPVHLYLKLYRHRNPSNPTPFDITTEDIEYEFYEMSHEGNPSDFDTSICHRSLDLEYLHVGFQLKLDKGNVVDGNHLSRRTLETRIHESLSTAMGIKYTRITDIEVDHERSSNDVTVFFTLLGPTPAPTPEAPNAVATDEPTAAQSKNKLSGEIDNGNFIFKLNLTDASNTEVQFKGIVSSLKASKQFMSSHATGSQVVNESYTKGSQAGAVIGGILVGLFVGIVLAAVIRHIRKDSMPAMPILSTSIVNRSLDVSFRNRKSATDTTTTKTTTTSDA